MVTKVSDKMSTLEQYQNLGNAIVIQAVDDYKNAYLGKPCGHRSTKDVLKECEKFFRSEWCSLLSNGIDADKIMEAARTQADYSEWRSRRKCNDCKLYSCVHKTGSKWFLYGTKECICSKEAKESFFSFFSDIIKKGLIINPFLLSVSEVLPFIYY